MPDFDQAHAPKKVTDPNNLGVTLAEYPKHLHKPWTFDADGLRVLHYRVAQNEEDEAALLKKGYALKASGPKEPEPDPDLYDEDQLPTDGLPDAVQRAKGKK